MAATEKLKLLKERFLSQEFGVSKRTEDKLKEVEVSLKDAQLNYHRQSSLLRMLRQHSRENRALSDQLGQQEAKLHFKDALSIDEVHWDKLLPSDWTEKRPLAIDSVRDMACEECIQIGKWLQQYQGKSLSEVQLQKLMSSVKEKQEDIKQKEKTLEDIKQQIHLKRTEHYKVLSESCSLLTKLITEYQVEYLTTEMESTVNHLTSKAQALDLKLKVINLELMVATYTQDTNAALKEIKSYLDSAQQQFELQLISAQQSLEHYKSLGPNFVTLADEYHQIMIEIENKKWSLQELGGQTRNHEPSTSPLSSS